MILTFKNKRVVSAIGRNGFIKQTGIEVLPIGDPKPDQVVTLSPVNSRGDVANGSIDIPVADIPEFVKALMDAYTEANPMPDNTQFWSITK